MSCASAGGIVVEVQRAAPREREKFVGRPNCCSLSILTTAEATLRIDHEGTVRARIAIRTVIESDDVRACFKGSVYFIKAAKHTFGEESRARTPTQSVRATVYLVLTL